MMQNYGYYQPMQNYPSYQPLFQQQQQNTPQDERIWVQNETSAEAYLVAPNGFVRLWDSSRPVFYEKRADNTGRPYPMDVFEYSRKSPKSAPVIEEPSNSIPSDIEAQIEALSKRIEALENMKKGVKNNAKQSSTNDATAESVCK